jgi:hypothetical protein
MLDRSRFSKVPGRRRARLVTAAVLALVALGASLGRAQTEAPISLSPVVPVTLDGTYPAVALAASGNGLVAWATDCEGVMVRRLQSDGALGPPRFWRDPFTEIRHVRAGADAAGNFVLAWQESAADGSGFGILAQRLRRDGEPRGALLRVNQLAAGDQTDPQLGVAPDGRFAVVFADERRSGSAVAPVLRLARFAANGARLGPPRPLPTAGAATPLSGGVVAGESFLAAGWTEVESCGGAGEDVRARVARVEWADASARLAASFGDGLSCAGGPLLAGLLGSGPGPLAILAGHTYNLQRFDPASVAPLGERTVFSALHGCAANACEVLAAVGGDPRGRFVAVWERRESSSGGDRFFLSIQLFGRDGRARRGPIVVTDEPSVRPSRPAVALAGNGTVHVLWEYAPDAATPPAILLRTVGLD